VTVEISARVRDHVSTTFGAITVIYALLLDNDASRKSLQLDLLRERLTAEFVREVTDILPLVEQIDRFAHLPTIDLAMPALRWMSPDQYTKFVSIMDNLIDVDQHLTLFEYAVRSIVKHRLGSQFGQPPTYHYRPSRATVRRDTEILLSGLARIGTQTEEGAREAFRLGLERIRNNGEGAPNPGRPSAVEIDAAVTRLAQIPANRKQAIVDACAHCVLADKDVTLEEAELLRVVIVALRCPLPPFLPSA
jgi:hypothetical protein